MPWFLHDRTIGSYIWIKHAYLIMGMLLSGARESGFHKFLQKYRSAEKTRYFFYTPHHYIRMFLHHITVNVDTLHFIQHLTMYLYNNKHILSICTYHGICINAYCLYSYTTHHINNQYFYTTYPIFAQFPILCTYLDFCSPTSIYRILNKPYQLRLIKSTVQYFFPVRQGEP